MYIKKAFDGGAQYYARKPSTFEQLKVLIDNILKMDLSTYAVRNFQTFVLNP
jgi:hypothetical protein